MHEKDREVNRVEVCERRTETSGQAPCPADEQCQSGSMMWFPGSDVPHNQVAEIVLNPSAVRELQEIRLSYGMA